MAPMSARASRSMGSVFDAHFAVLSISVFSHPANLHQHLRHPAPGASWKQPDPLWLALLLRGHLLHGGLWRRHSADMALAASGGHHDLRGTHRASHPGNKTVIICTVFCKWIYTLEPQHMLLIPTLFILVWYTSTLLTFKCFCGFSIKIFVKTWGQNFNNVYGCLKIHTIHVCIFSCSNTLSFF